MRTCDCGSCQDCLAAASHYLRKRGSSDRRAGRFGRLLQLEQRIPINDVLQTETRVVSAKSIISKNSSPDIPWSQTLNPYQGCEHGCVYCYARPSHAYYDLSPGLDFETKLFAKSNAAILLREEFLRPHYRPQTIALGSNTDAYQPIERKYLITRSILEVMLEFRHPVSVLSKSSLILRDIDLLAALAKLNLVEIHFSLSTLDVELARKLEPRAALPKNRLSAIRQLAGAGIPVKVMMAPLIPGLTDHEMASIMQAVQLTGAKSIGYILLRLTFETQGIFEDWLSRHYPAAKVEILQRILQSRTVEDATQRFATRMTGSGAYAQNIQQQFSKEFSKLGFQQLSPSDLNHQAFTTRYATGQFDLFAD